MLDAPGEVKEEYVHCRSLRSLADSRLLGSMRTSSAQLYRRSIKRYIDGIELHLRETGLKLGEAQREQIARTSAEFLRHLRLGFRFPRLSVKTVVVIVAHQLLQAELGSELLEAEDLLVAISPSAHAKKRLLGLYLCIHRQSFGRSAALRYLERVKRQAAEFVVRYDGDAGSLPALDHLLGLLTSFSECLRLGLRNKRLRNLAMALALTTLQATKGIAPKPAEFVASLKRCAWHRAPAADTLLDRISPSSVTRIILEFSCQFHAFVREKVGSDEKSFRQICRKSNLLTTAVVKVLGLEQTPVTLRDNFWLLLRTATLCKKFLIARRLLDPDL